MDVIFVTGNEKKAKYFSELIRLPIEHRKADVHEIQSLDLIEIVEYKAKEAFKQIERPVIVEDASVAISSLGKLPGPLIKWFVEELGLERICRLADIDEDCSATASDVFAYYDGETFKHFARSLSGTIAKEPRGSGGYDWDRIFVPHYSELTLAEVDDQNYQKGHLQIKPIEQVKELLESIDKK